MMMPVKEMISMFNKAIRETLCAMKLANTKTCMKDELHAIGTEGFKADSSRYRPRNRTCMWHEEYLCIYTMFIRGYNGMATFHRSSQDIDILS